MPLKIALLGSHPHSLRIAPFSDPNWLMWGCSPGVYGVAPRVDCWFELHRWEPGQPWFSPEYCQWMSKLKVPVFMAKAMPEVIPMSRPMEVEALVKKYGPYFFTSSLAWMCATAIELIISEPGFKPGDGSAIGFWGVDMAATEEYGYQRAGCQFFAMMAQAMGIEVGVPPESDLLVPSPLYGISEVDHAQIKLLQRQRELDARIKECEARLDAARMEVHYLKGGMDDAKYMKMTWGGRDNNTAPQGAEVLREVFQPAPAPLAPVDLGLGINLFESGPP